MNLELLRVTEETYKTLYLRTSLLLKNEHYNMKDKVTPTVVEKSVSNILDLYEFTTEYNQRLNKDDLDSRLFKYNQDKV